jgi:hypothetical protein
MASSAPLSIDLTEEKFGNVSFKEIILVNEANCADVLSMPLKNRY